MSLSDGTSLELVEEGAATQVTFASRHRFVHLAIQARLNEGAAQCDAIQAGLQAVLPCSRLLRLMSGKELQLLVCGEADVDLATVRPRAARPQPRTGSSAPGGLAAHALGPS